ncbi:MAG TPA: HNH endonuclease [Polyangiales bacterium]|nr:HNH endonuclease [Polyangiales bacterium]
MSRTRALLLLAAESDQTFERATIRGREYWVGRCIHCQSKVTVPLASDEPASGTLEHIIAKHHDGTNALENLSVACARCNRGKGKRLDKRRRDDPTLTRVIAALQEHRRARQRSR